MFEYQKLDLGGSGFRLVRLLKGYGFVIECELIHATLDDNVIPSLLWLDAICINQDDDLERGHQVQRMKHIYQSAESGIFYLSPYTDIVRVIMESLALLQKQVANACWAYDDEKWGLAWKRVQTGLQAEHNNLGYKQYLGLRYLINRSFFRRVWILQEVASVRRASVYCGTRPIPAHIFAMGPRFVGVGRIPHISAVLSLMYRSPDTSTSSFQGSLAYLLTEFGSAEASDERDRVYALLGLCETKKDTKALTPDYTIGVEDIVKQALTHIYGPFLPSFLPHVTTVDALVRLLRGDPFKMIKYLLGLKESQEAVFDYISGTEPRLDIIRGDLAMAILRHLVQSSRWPMEILNEYRDNLVRRFNFIPHRIVSLALEKEWHADILNYMCQHGRKVVIGAHVSFIVKMRHTKWLKALMKPCDAEVVVDVSMRGLWALLLLVPDDDIEALIPLLNGVEKRTKAVLTHLRTAASESPGSLRCRDAILLLWRLTGNVTSGHDNDSMPIKGNDHLNSQYGSSYEMNRMVGGEDKRTAALTSSMLRHHFSGRPMHLDPQLDLSSTGEWRFDMSRSIHYIDLNNLPDEETKSPIIHWKAAA
ncbi:hypothetical protein CIB48_g4531 [Xylaria polymorpha]|nr:hypothetical protein CIB48_g4531 [Xylaria polymorpha]